MVAASLQPARQRGRPLQFVSLAVATLLWVSIGVAEAFAGDLGLLSDGGRVVLGMWAVSFRDVLPRDPSRGRNAEAI